MNLTHKIQSGLGVFLLLLCMAHVGAAQTTCNPPWNSTSVYTAGMKVSLNGINYTANFWTQGQSPATNNGGAGSGFSHGPAMDHVADRVVVAVAARARQPGTAPLFTLPETLQV